MSRKGYHWLAVTSLISLILLTLAWELWLAPIRTGGSFLAIKALVLLLPLFGILREKIYTYQWSSMFILLPFTEGVMRAWGDKGLSQWLAGRRSLAVAAVLFGGRRLCSCHPPTKCCPKNPRLPLEKPSTLSRLLALNGVRGWPARGGMARHIPTLLRRNFLPFSSVNPRVSDVEKVLCNPCV